MENIIDNIKEEFKVFEEKKKQMVKELREQFPAILKPLFDKSSKINSVGWTQYTPHFNDGDTCEFSVNRDKESLYINCTSVYDIPETKEDLSVYITEINKEEVKEYISKKGYSWLKDRKIGESSYIQNKDQDFKLVQEIKDFHNILTDIPEELFKDLFGDHVKVTIHRGGNVVVEDYDHD